MAARKAKTKRRKKEPTERTIICEHCGEEWTEPVRPGRVARLCLGCRDPRNRSRDLRRLEERGEGDRAEKARAAAAAPPGTEIAIRPLRLAVALGMSRDPRLAAASAGLDPDDPTIDLEALIADAVRRFPAIAEGKSGELQRLLQSAAAQSAVSLFATASRLSGPQAAAAVKSVAQSLDLIQAGAKRVYSKVTILMPKRGAA